MSWLPQEWLKTVVMIERSQVGDKGIEFIPVGTGFITEYKNINILVTCKSVIYELEKKNDNIFVSFNLKNGVRARRQIEEIKHNFSVDWLFYDDSNIDIAMIPYSIDENNDDIRRMGRDLYESVSELSEGEEIFFLGFPLGIDPGFQYSMRPLVRQGIVSLIQPDKNFLIEAHVYPGNIGSPVFLKPSLVDFKNNTFGTIRPAKFIGIISHYIPYIDTAVSLQTRRPRIVFEENSGLARVISADYITEMFKSERFKKVIKTCLFRKI